MEAAEDTGGPPDAAGLDDERAWASAYNGHGPWWNAGASHMHAAFRADYFHALGLVRLLDQRRRLNRAS